MYRSVRKRGSGCFCPTFVQVSTSSILCGKCLRPIQDGHVREAPLEKVVRRGKTKAPSSNYNNRTILLYCRHLGDSRNLERKPTRADKIARALLLFPRRSQTNSISSSSQLHPPDPQTRTSKCNGQRTKYQHTQVSQGGKVKPEHRRHRRSRAVRSFR